MFIKTLINKYNDLRKTNDDFAFYTSALPMLLSVLIVLVICQPW